MALVRDESLTAWWKEPDATVLVSYVRDGRIQSQVVAREPVLTRVVRSYLVEHPSGSTWVSDLFGINNGTLVARGVPHRQLTFV